MSGQFKLRNLLISTAIVAVCMSAVAYSLRNEGSSLAQISMVCIAMVGASFLLFGIMFALLLPLGVIDAMARESVEPSASPFATDRLPEQQIVPKDIEPSR